MSFKNAIACKVVESPPKEIIDEQIIVFEYKLIFKLDVDKQPFVISKIPSNIDEEIDVSIFNFESIKFIG